MNALQSELRRLYLPPSGAAPAPGDADPPPGVPGAGNATRCLVLELARPADWRVLGRVWQGVQAELELPAPAIAVSGTDGMQLWFSLERPVAAAQAQAFLQALAARFLADVAPGRLRLMPSADAAAPDGWFHAPSIPAPHGPDGNWSAFVAPDLAPVFGETPWLDIPPGEDGQAALLRGLRPVGPAAFADALRRLRPRSPATAPPPAATSPAGRARSADGACADASGGAPGHEDPQDFLRRVMNDAGVPLALRIEAAKALLAAPDAGRRG